MQNMFQIYKGHHSKITSTPFNQLTLCNYQIKEEFPMDGKCQTLDVVYDCRATSPESRKITLLKHLKKVSFVFIPTIGYHYLSKTIQNFK